MNRLFPLAGLLRLRRLEQDQAAANLGSVNTRLAALNARQESARIETERTPSEATDAASLRAIAAARVSSMSMLADLRHLTRIAEDDREQAQAALAVTRARTIGLEKLEERHGLDVAAADLAAEQGVLDELASASWQRNLKEVTG